MMQDELRQNNVEQNLRSNSKENLHHTIQDHSQQIYESSTQSFNEQKHLYTEQAMNVRTKPREEYVSEDGNGEKEFSRYIKNTLDFDNTSSKSESSPTDNAFDTIFDASDLEIANATENYLNKDSQHFSHKLEKLDGKRERTKKKVDKIERDELKYKPWKSRLVIDKKAGNYSVIENKGRGVFAKTYKTEQKTFIGRLKFRTESIAYTERQYKSQLRRANIKSDMRRQRLKTASQKIKETASGSEFEDDEMPAELKRKSARLKNNLSGSVRKNYRRLKRENSSYSRLKYQKARLAAYDAKTELVRYKSGIDLQKRKAEEAERQGLLREKNKHKVKKEMVQKYKREQGSFAQRTRHQHYLKKTVKKEQKIARKRIKALVSSASGIIAVLILVFFSIALFMTILVSIGGEAHVNTTSQNDYYTMTEATAYFREKEADLEEKIKPENMELLLLAEYPDIYEFVYIYDEICFDANTLVAYLSAKYNEFDMSIVSTDLDALFEQYYTHRVEIKEEEREVYDTTQKPDPVTGEYPIIKIMAKICYVYLEKVDFYELCKSRIEDEAKKNQMDIFYQSGNGQQIYGPVMIEDWRNKISSNYGWRIHPITGVKTFHAGVDIAIPTGTALYSPVDGTVIKSYYSNSGGNMLTVETKSGWEITYMHMDTRYVYVGDEVVQGQQVGASGNTGNSTGPHLHLEVCDAEGNTINPVFIIPFATIESSETY